MKPRHFIALLPLCALLLVACGREANAQVGAASSTADWPTYNHDAAGWRFNPPEKTLGPANVGQPVEKWRFPAAGSKETVGVVHATRVQALPSPVGGLQTGCAMDGRTIFSNGINGIQLGTQESPLAAGQLPTGGRVTATSTDLRTERWRHERPKIPEMGGTPGNPIYRDVGDVVGSGIAAANGVAYFTAVGSGKVVALDAATGAVLKEITIGPLWEGPSVSRGRVYVGGATRSFHPTSLNASSPSSTLAASVASACPETMGRVIDPVGPTSPHSPKHNRGAGANRWDLRS